MAKTDFENYLCRHFCVYYRPGVKEDLLCRGALVVEKLIRSGRLTITELPQGSFLNSLVEHLPLLDEQICGSCEFRAADCDFQALPAIPDSPPCGGYRLLALLLKNHQLAAEDLTSPDNA